MKIEGGSFADHLFTWALVWALGIGLLSILIGIGYFLYSIFSPFLSFNGSEIILAIVAVVFVPIVFRATIIGFGAYFESREAKKHIEKVSSKT